MSENKNRQTPEGGADAVGDQVVVFDSILPQHPDIRWVSAFTRRQAAQIFLGDHGVRVEISGRLPQMQIITGNTSVR